MAQHPDTIEYDIVEDPDLTKGAGMFSLGVADWKDWKDHMPKHDGQYEFQWNHRAVRFPEAIEFATQPDSERGYDGLDLTTGPEATGITVIQLDTGWSEHHKLFQEPCYRHQDSFDEVNNGAGKPTDPGDGKDNLLSYTIPNQKAGHGTATGHTFVRGKATDTFDGKLHPINRSKGIFSDNLNQGLFPFVNFVPVRAARKVVLLLNGINSSGDVARAIERGMRMNPGVMTMSMGTDLEEAALLRRAVRKAYQRGIIIVAAAGNSSMVDSVFEVVKPAEFPETIAASALEPRRSNGTIFLDPWKDGCDGPQVDVSAPGKYIYTAYVDRRIRWEPSSLEELPPRRQSMWPQLLPCGGMYSPANWSIPTSRTTHG